MDKSLIKPEDIEALEESVFELLYAQGYALFQAGNSELAAPIFKEIARFRPHVFKYWFGLGAARQMSGAYREALKAWETLISMDETNALYHFYKAECLISLENVKEALLSLEQAKKRTKSLPVLEKIEFLIDQWSPHDSTP